MKPIVSAINDAWIKEFNPCSQAVEWWDRKTTEVKERGDMEKYTRHELTNLIWKSQYTERLLNNVIFRYMRKRALELKKVANEGVITPAMLDRAFGLEKPIPDPIGRLVNKMQQWKLKHGRDDLYFYALIAKKYFKGSKRNSQT